MSTSSTLSDERLYQYFFRTVPSDTNQVDAIIDILSLLSICDDNKSNSFFQYRKIRKKAHDKYNTEILCFNI
ncbi:hypothetical protein BLA29_008140 [Euroglyphus maynei]|uniref:Receptor ligand binding region domain-containing protein n=1 Tax=Euroglyphus maynei TaxID=6958 RepID=A0A1Y3B692_EURMA|nr:hypothetical protein BLA29_008140 [Euroglyphus maynei]